MPVLALQTFSRNGAGAPVTHQRCLTDRLASGGIRTMRMRRTARSVSTFMTQLCAALLKALVTSMVLGIVLVSIMHHMGVPVPSVAELLRGVSRLAHVLS